MYDMHSKRQYGIGTISDSAKAYRREGTKAEVTNTEVEEVRNTKGRAED